MDERVESPIKGARYLKQVSKTSPNLLSPFPSAGESSWAGFSFPGVQGTQTIGDPEVGASAPPA